jgi:hypothetical protein
MTKGNSAMMISSEPIPYFEPARARIRTAQTSENISHARLSMIQRYHEPD